MAPRSESEYTATVGMSISRHVRMIRQAISPRFAMSNLVTGMASSSRMAPDSNWGIIE